MKENKIIQLTDREHILKRSSMYIGGITPIKKECYLLEDKKTDLSPTKLQNTQNKFVLSEVEYIPGFLKIIDEIIDNSVDEGIRTSFEFSNLIKIIIKRKSIPTTNTNTTTNTNPSLSFQIIDNGRGVPLTLINDTPMAVLAFTEARAGGNFDDKHKANGIGMNGIGSFLTNVYSKYFEVITTDGKNALILKSSNNAENFTYEITDSKNKKVQSIFGTGTGTGSGTGLGTGSGTSVEFFPDLEKFNLNTNTTNTKTDTISDIYIKLLMNRCFLLSQSFPLLKFVFQDDNSGPSPSRSKSSPELIKNLPPKKFLEMFSEKSDTLNQDTKDTKDTKDNKEFNDFEMIQEDNYFFAIFSNPDDDFKQFSYVNGLNISRGGTHIDYIMSNTVSRLKDALSKKYKSIKTGDIKNKLRIICVFREFNNLQFDSQTKELVTNSSKQIKDYLGEIDFDNFVKKILKNQKIISLITEIYKIKEEFEKRQELKKLDKTKKEIISDKYTPAIKTKKYLALCEGRSAFSGILPSLGRNEFGYYELKGKPLNAYGSEQKKFTDNQELSELYSIIKNEEYDNILIATDADADGSNITALLLGFFKKYLPELLTNKKIKRLKTPLLVLKKNKKIDKWFYDFNSFNTFNSNSNSNSETNSDSDKTNKQIHYDIKYYKGYGTWEPNDLKFIIEKENGIQNMMETFNDDDNHKTNLDYWLLSEYSDKRKEFIIDNDFNINRI